MSISLAELAALISSAGGEEAPLHARGRCVTHTYEEIRRNMLHARQLVGEGRSILN